MATTFVFLGAHSEVLGAGIKLTRFGQRVDLPPDLAEQTKMHGGLPCIPVEQFDAIFDPKDPQTALWLKKYAVASSHDRQEMRPNGFITIKAVPEFLEKKKQALTVLHEIREAWAAEHLPVPADIPAPIEEGV
jgi:hypothetical protein